MKINTLVPAIALAIAAVTAIPAIVTAQVQDLQSARTGNAGATGALKTRIAVVRARIVAGRRSGTVMRARAMRLVRQVDQVQSNMIRRNRQQGFSSAAELASYSHTLNAVDIALDGYGVPHGDGDVGLVAGPDRNARTSPCNNEATPSLIGHPALGDEALRRLTGSQTIRRVLPGAIMTQDYLENRLTMHLDGAGNVVSASCG